MWYLYTAFVIFAGVALKNVVVARWGQFKAREAAKPQQMVMRKGVYVPWGTVQRVERVVSVAFVIWCICMAALVALLIYLKVS